MKKIFFTFVFLFTLLVPVAAEPALGFGLSYGWLNMTPDLGMIGMDGYVGRVGGEIRVILVPGEYFDPYDVSVASVSLLASTLPLTADFSWFGKIGYSEIQSSLDYDGYSAELSLPSFILGIGARWFPFRYLHIFAELETYISGEAKFESNYSLPSWFGINVEEVLRSLSGFDGPSLNIGIGLMYW